MPVNAPCNGYGQQTTPSTMVSRWTDMVAAAGVAVTPPITNTASATPYSNIQILKRDQGRGLEVAVRLKYPTLEATITPVKYVLLGRAAVSSGTPDPWEMLPNRAGATEVTITPDTAVDDGDDIIATPNRYTSVDPEANIHDTMGCDEFCIAVTQDLATSGAGTPANARLQAKVY